MFEGIAMMGGKGWNNSSFVVNTKKQGVTLQLKSEAGYFFLIPGKIT